MDSVPRPHDDIRMEGTTQTAEIMGVMTRFNAVTLERWLGSVNPLGQAFRAIVQV
jgi:hypothetical protein